MVKIKWGTGKGRKPQIIRDLEGAIKEIQKISKKVSKW